MRDEGDSRGVEDVVGQIQENYLTHKYRKADPKGTAREAAARFLRLESFSGATVSQLIERREDVKLKHALAVIAQEQGYG